jgi:hypothetical protein
LRLGSAFGALYWAKSSDFSDKSDELGLKLMKMRGKSSDKKCMVKKCGGNPAIKNVW